MVSSTSSLPTTRIQATAPTQTSANRRAEAAIAFVIFLICFAYLCIFRHFTTLEADEGIVLQGATRVLHGQVPYRDFFSFYTPGSFYLLAGVFRTFGNSFVVARTSLAAVGALCSVVTYLLARRVCPRGISVLAALLATVTGTAFRFLVLHNYYSTALACLAVYCAVRLVEEQKFLWAFATGSLVALTFLFEQSKGGGLALGLVGGFIVLRHSRRSSPLSLRALAAGLFWPFLLTFAYFASQHAMTAMLKSWLWPLHHYTAANHVPYGWQNWSDDKRTAIFATGPLAIRVVKALVVSPGFIVPVLPLIALGVLLYWAIRTHRSSEHEPRSGYYIIVCSVAAGLLLSIVMTRADILHFMYLAPLFYVVLAWVLGAPVQNRALLQARPPLILYVATAFGMLGLAVLLSTTGAHQQMQTRRGLIVTSGIDTVIPFVQAHSRPGDKLMVYPYLPLYNYLTATQSPSRYDFFQPGMNTVQQAQEIVAALQSSADRRVLFEPGFTGKIAESWPETPVSALAKDPVADYVVHHFRVCRILDSPDGEHFEYMVKTPVGGSRQPCSE